GTGTPSTGSVVLEAIMPGRCAEPPAPAMMHASPRSRACSAYSNIASGVRCADTTRCSNGTPKSFSTFAACCITSQSLWDPITTPTFGFSSIWLEDYVKSSNTEDTEGKPETHPA